MAAFRWLDEGSGYEITSVDVIDTYDLALEAADRSHADNNVLDQIRGLLDQTKGAGKRL